MISKYYENTVFPDYFVTRGNEPTGKRSCGFREPRVKKKSVRLKLKYAIAILLVEDEAAYKTVYAFIRLQNESRSSQVSKEKLSTGTFVHTSNPLWR